ncbi:MAG: hypothetical protein NZP34_15885, partial [Caldilineales bacterium]|nr:hypothetical protein [Caldilineales bacterium]
MSEDTSVETKSAPVIAQQPGIIRRILQRPETSIIIVLAVLSGFLSQSSEAFLTPDNLFNI